MPLSDSDDVAIARLYRYGALPKISKNDAEWIDFLVSDAPHLIADARNNFGPRKIFRTGISRARAKEAATYLIRNFNSSFVSGALGALTRSEIHNAAVPTSWQTDAPFLASVLRARFEHLGNLHVFTTDLLAGLPESLMIVQRLIESEPSKRREAFIAAENYRKITAQKIMERMPLSKIRDATRDRLSLSELRRAGFETINDVFVSWNRLESLPDVTPSLAHQIRGAARSIWDATFREVSYKFDPDHPTFEARALISALAQWSLTNKSSRHAEITHIQSLAPLTKAAMLEANNLAVWTCNPAQVVSDIQATNKYASEIQASVNKFYDIDNVWNDFIARPADYYAMLHNIGLISENNETVSGDLPESVIDAVRNTTLNTKYLTASLRGYQSFAARFALAQKKVIIGDEMGLGKTIEALAVFAHLNAFNRRHTLVICPAAVLTNWMREVRKHTTLRAHLLHGESGIEALQRWRKQGGVAVTSYGSLGRIDEALHDLDLDCVAVDEAHYIKNPKALRSIRSSRIIEQASNAILLTGTPLENRAEEFHKLVDYVNPAVAAGVDLSRPLDFRYQIAPVYLRRNQEDVLTELPERIEIEHWLPHTELDASNYHAATLSGNFHTMRQSAFLSGEGSAKINRLLDIVNSAELNGRKVIVFSHYLAVLDVVVSVLQARAWGPITGAVSPTKRQQLVDDFHAASPGAVLVSQIQAGGTGLNVQAASVVIICEPQLKPSTEWQAIGRSHRMGQLKTVQVHRLLSEEGIDIHVRSMLAGKHKAFNEFAAISETAIATPEAFDITEQELVRRIISAEQARLFLGDSGADTIT